MRVRSVRDGDTLNVVVSLVPTLGIDARLACRIAALNAPEMSTPEGVAAKQFTSDWVAQHAPHAPADTEWPFLTRVDGWDNYGGRYDGGVRCWMGHDLGEALIASGQAVWKRYRAILPESFTEVPHDAHG
jgi:endonuclease YncB( thermonuclease family)